MCSVIGFSGKYDEAILNEVYKHSRIRGLHAFGFAYCNDGTLEVRKFLDYEKFVNTLNEIKPNKFVAHFRYSTSGDYKDADNNQPLTLNDTALVFNGVISQKPKKEMEKEFGCELSSENDGWILLNNFKAFKELKQTKMTYASLFLQNNYITALRNKKRPLWKGNDGDNIYIASTKDILQRSGIGNCKLIEHSKYHQW